MPKYKVKSNVTVGTRDAQGNVTSKDYRAGDSVELTEQEATTMGYALEDAPVDESIPESTRLRPDHPDSGVAAAHKVDLPAAQVAASEAQARQNVLDSPSAEFSDDAALAEDLEKGSTENVARQNAPKRAAGGGARNPGDKSPTTSNQPAPPAGTTPPAQ